MAFILSEDQLLLLRIATTFVGIAGLLALALMYESNVRLLQQKYPVKRVPVQTERTLASASRGKYLADITGCTDCHAPDLRGKTFIDDGWWRGRYYSANVTLKAQQYSDEDIARIVRDGIRPDGTGVIAMPSFGYVRLTDAEIADLIAFIRSLPAGGAVQPAHHIGPLDQWDLWVGRRLKPAVTYVTTERLRNPPSLGTEFQAGQHLVGIVCVECHAGDLTGNGWDSGAPDLAVIGSYTYPLFVRLLRTGIGADGKRHGLMSQVAEDRLHQLTDEDISAIYDYLVRRSTRHR